MAVVQHGEAARAQVEAASDEGGSAISEITGSGAVTAVSIIERAESAEVSSDGTARAEDGSIVAHLDDAATDVAALLSDIAGREALLTLWGGSDPAAPEYIWEIAGVKLPQESDYSNVDLTLVNATGSDMLDAALGDGAYSAFTVPGVGKLPSTMQLLWRTDSTIDNGQVVDVYLFDEGAGTFKKVHSNLKTGEGYVTFNLIERGTYVVTADSDLAEGAAAEVDVGDDDVPIAAAESPGGAPDWAAPAAIAFAAVVVAVAAFAFASRKKRDSRE